MSDGDTRNAADATAEANGSALQDAYRRWSESAAAVLAKSRRVSANELPGSPEELLTTTLPGSLTVKPRRTWVRARREGSRTVVHVAVLDRVPRVDLPADLDRLVERIRTEIGAEAPDQPPSGTDEGDAT